MPTLTALKSRTRPRGRLVVPIAAMLTAGGLLAPAIATAVTSDPAPQYTGCLNAASGHITNVAIGTAPRMDCVKPEVQITWNQTGPQGPQGIPGPQGPQGVQGEPGKNVAAGQACPAGQFVTGFDATGNILCATPTPPAPACPANSKLTFSMTSSPTDTLENWPGGDHTLAVSGYPGCSVTVTYPSGNISLVGGTVGADAWVIKNWTGFTSASGQALVPVCNSFLAAASITAGPRPTCSNSSTVLESGHSTASFVVTAS